LFKIDDFWKIFDLLKGDITSTGLSDVVDSVAQSEFGKTTNLFNNVIDQVSFNTDDYNRFKNFFITWYASHKTITSIQNKSSDPFSIPNTNLDELFRSFGFEYSNKFANIINTSGEDVNENKVNFFLDLVNLYKVKGTPNGLLNVLEYFGLNNIDINEYWLQKNEDGDLIFRSEIIVKSTNEKEVIDIEFSEITKNDNHWMLSESQILSLAEANSINFPSKSPYYEVRKSRENSATVYIVSRIIQDQYEAYQSTGVLPTQDALISILDEPVSFLELYLSTVYLFSEDYDYGNDNGPFLCYDATSFVQLDVISEYETLISNPSSREIREARLNQYFNNFTRNSSQNFLQTKSSVETILTTINSDLKDKLDNISIINKDEDVLLSFLIDISNWTNVNVVSKSSNIFYLIFGIPGLKRIYGDILNFFKPYRARMISSEIVSFHNRLLDSIRYSDLASMDIEQTVIDWDTANSKSCCLDLTVSCPDSTSGLLYSRETFDCGSYYDIGAVNDREEINIEDTYSDTLMCIPTDSTNNNIIHNLSYDSTSNIDLNIIEQIKESAGLLESDNISEVYVQTGGFCDFDGDGVFDCVSGFDNFNILVQEV